MYQRPAYDKLRPAMEALVRGSEPIAVRLQAAEKHFGRLSVGELDSVAERALFLRIGSQLVEGANEDSSVAESIATLADERAGEIAGELFRLFELVAGIADEGSTPWPQV